MVFFLISIHMFQPVPVLPPGGFITALAVSQGDLRVGYCRFDTQRFHDGLSQVLAIPLPARLAQAVTRRRAEYLASRFLARQLLQDLGHADFLLTNAPDRSPCWPDGIAASLSHTRGIAVMAATRQPRCVGIDVEQMMSVETAEETAGMLMNQAERQLLRALPLPFAAAATLLFSLKESLYKALWPVIRQPMDFHQAALVAVDMPAGEARLSLTTGLSQALPQETLLKAYFRLQPGEVMTLINHPC